MYVCMYVFMYVCIYTPNKHVSQPPSSSQVKCSMLETEKLIYTSVFNKSNNNWSLHCVSLIYSNLQMFTIYLVLWKTKIHI